MTSYNIEFEECDKYAAVIYSVSYNNPIQDIRQISEEMRKHFDSSCYVLFDLLLSNGDEFNRFAEAYFDGEEIKFDSISTIKLQDESKIKKINEHYKGKVKQLNQSVLSSREKLRYVR